MARLPRYFVSGQPQHVILRGNNRQVIFAAEDDYQFFRDCLVEAAQRFGLAVHAYVWMTNHVHLLATPNDAASLPKTLQSAGRRYVQYFNFTYHRSGTLWEGRYRATVIDSEPYLLTCMRYIEQNPVRAGMVKRPEAYRWSSYAGNALGKAGFDYDWLIPHSLYEALGRDGESRRRAYRALFRCAVPESDMTAIRESTHKGWALGDGRFRAKIEKLGQRRAAPLPRGRPGKEESH